MSGGKMRKGTIRSLLTALLCLVCLTLVSNEVFNISYLPAHQIAVLSMVIWIISCLAGYGVFCVVRRQTHQQFS